MSKPVLRLNLPPSFLSTLGYERAVAAAAQFAAGLVARGVISEAAPAVPRRFVALYWQAAGDELAWDDGRNGGAGQLNHWPFLDWRHKALGPFEWQQHDWSLGSSEEEESHWLVCDRETNRGYIWPKQEAREIVRAQLLPKDYAG